MSKEELEKVIKTLRPSEILALDSIIIQGNSNKADTRGASLLHLQRIGLLSPHATDSNLVYSGGPISQFFEISERIINHG